jgi:hypothetical protein
MMATTNMTLHQQTLRNAPVPTTKLHLGHIIERYRKYVIEPFKDKAVKLLEIGIAKGQSLEMFRDALPHAHIIGLDIGELPELSDIARISMNRGEQQDANVLDTLGSLHAPDGFDVIIDDGSHIGQYTRIAFWHLFRKHLKRGGLYFIEDWGCSYWPHFPDGKHYSPKEPDFSIPEKLLNSAYRSTKNRFLRRVIGHARYRLVKRQFPSHQYGMVGFVKELVDECGCADRTDKRWGCGEPRKSMIHEMTISPGLVMITKA